VIKAFLTLDQGFFIEVELASVAEEHFLMVYRIT
jgi:hypothetical protein